MAKIEYSFTKMIEDTVRQTFEKIMFEEIDKIRHQSIAKIDVFTKEQKEEAKKAALKMTLELIQQMDAAQVSVQFRV